MRCFSGRVWTVIRAAFAIIIVTSLGCARPSALSSQAPTARDNLSGEFVGSSGSIRIDLDSLTVGTGTGTHRLENCSDAELFCYKNESLGFHIVFPRSCRRPYRVEGETASGFTFRNIKIVPHEDIRAGQYISSLSNRFAYGYAIDLGLYEILYDSAGRIGFGPRDAGDSMSMTEAQPYTYRLTEGRTFLRCSR
jgi:hypothetical protein